MSYNQYNISGDNTFNSTFSDRDSNLLESSENAISNKLHDFLSKFSGIESWDLTYLKDLNSDSSNKRVNNIFIGDILLKKHDPNLVFNTIRQIIESDKYFAFRTTTSENIKTKLQHKFPTLLFYFYYPFYFLIRRVIPRVKGIKEIARFLHMYADMPRAEVIGRLIYKGFDIVDFIDTGYETVLITKVNLTKNPSMTKDFVCEGFIFKMDRLGKEKENIIVYKIRTMHPYAEYISDYLHKTYGLDTGGKFKNDFRVSTTGRVLRKYWIDEFPMFINLLKGDIKLVGVRPISSYYFSLYPPEAQEIRSKHKPGLLPPFYADMPNTFNEIVQSEINYLNQYEKAPFKTDVTYLIKIAKNILIKKARSK
ncbi:hypothetical protein GCM10028807_27690 [Spirosoma daeguense]